MSHPIAHWPSPWTAEDGGPMRQQVPHGGGGLGIRPGETLAVTARFSIASTMVVLRDPGEVYLLCHTGGDESVSWVEQIHPHTLETLRRSADLPGGPVWPGGLAAHANGSLYVVFGRHAHRLSATLEIEASVELPRNRPYNSFVLLPDGNLATKDFGGARPGHPDGDALGASELLALAADDLCVLATCPLPEPSIARLSADGNDVYVVGDTTLQRVRWDGAALHLAPAFQPVYRTMDGQTFGWDAVIDGGAAWFLDNGKGSEQFNGSLFGLGVSTAPLHLVRIDLSDAAVTMAEVCGLSGGLIANPPAIDVERGIAVGYDTGNGMVQAFRITDDALDPLWVKEMHHGAHPLRFSDTGELVLCDHDVARGTDQVVVLDIETGREIARADTTSPIQSLVFQAPGFERDVYYCSMSTVARITVRAAP
jgi:hypothetical protein